MFWQIFSSLLQSDQMLDIFKSDFRLQKYISGRYAFLATDSSRAGNINHFLSTVGHRLSSFELWSSFLRIRPMTNQYLIRINMSSPLPVIIQRNDIHFSADSIEINQYASILCANPRCCRIA